MRFRLRFKPGRRQNPQVVGQIQKRLRAPLAGKSGRQVISVMRKGPGSVGEQIDRRTFYDRDGGRRHWVEPSITGNRLPEAAQVREQVLWDAARGRSAAGSTRVQGNSVSLIVDDRVVAQQSAQIGNKIVSPANYFDFVTGGWDKRTTPAPARPAKPSRKPGITAMGAYVGITYQRWLTQSELAAGVHTPPKNIGVNPVMLERAANVVLTYVGTGLAAERENRQLALSEMFNAHMAQAARRAGVIT